MIDQIKFIGIIIAIIIGFSLITYAHNLYKTYLVSYIKMIWWHLISINLLMMLIFLSKYTEINIIPKLPDTSSTVATIHYLKYLSYYFIYLILLGIAYSMIGIIFGFKRKAIPALTKKIVVILFFVITLSSLVGVFIQHGIVNYWYQFFYQNFGILLLPLELIVLVKILMISDKKADLKELWIYKMFAVLYLTRYLFIILSFLLIPEILRITTILLYLNIIPYLWLNYYFVPYFKNQGLIGSSKDILNLLIKEYTISEREKDIIKMVLSGKSNREIGDALFISIRTVKNHIYNIYQKMNINSRYQLIQKYRNLENSISSKQSMHT